MRDGSLGQMALSPTHGDQDKSYGWLETLGSTHFLDNIEMRLSLSLGRKLAHATSESEEYFLSQENRRNLGSNMEKWAGLETNRTSRGLGDFEIIKQSSDSASVIVNHFSSGPMEAGIVASSWEFAKKRRHKFRWSESGRVLLVSLEIDEINVPLPKESIPIGQKISLTLLPLTM